MITIGRDGKPIEYLFTVKLKKTGEVKQVVALGLAGVAVLLKVGENDFHYITKTKTKGGRK